MIPDLRIEGFQGGVTRQVVFVAQLGMACPPAIAGCAALQLAGFAILADQPAMVADADNGLGVPHILAEAAALITGGGSGGELAIGVVKQQADTADFAKTVVATCAQVPYLAELGCAAGSIIHTGVDVLVSGGQQPWPTAVAQPEVKHAGGMAGTGGACFHRVIAHGCRQPLPTGAGVLHGVLAAGVEGAGAHQGVAITVGRGGAAIAFQQAVSGQDIAQFAQQRAGHANAGIALIDIQHAGHHAGGRADQAGLHIAGGRGQTDKTVAGAEGGIGRRAVQPQIALQLPVGAQSVAQLFTALEADQRTVRTDAAHAVASLTVGSATGADRFDGFVQCAVQGDVGVGQQWQQEQGCPKMFALHGMAPVWACVGD